MYASLLAALWCSAAAQAQVNANKFVVEEDRQVWRFTDADTGSVEKYVVLRALSNEGTQALTSLPLDYQDGQQSLELLEAYTLKPDDRRLPVTPEAIQKQTGALGGSTGASMPELRVWQLKYPDVQIGDRVVLHYKLSQLKPGLPGWQSQQWYANRSFATQKLSIEVKAPKDLPLAVESAGVQASRSQEGPLQILRFTAQVEALPGEPGARNMASTVERVLVSTLASNVQLGDLYAQAAQPQVHMSPGLRALAERQTQGLTAPAAKVHAVYDWVRKNIRYNAVYLGAGGWVPHDTDYILAQGYGDCKDHAALLIALLQAVGITAEPALINTAGDFVLPTLAAASAFNHAIVHVPSLDLYLDPTSTDTPYGELPYGDHGKPVVLARTQGSVLAQTPNLNAQDNLLETQGDFKLSATGELQGVLRVHAHGNAALNLQQRLAQIPPGKEADTVRQWLEGDKLTGAGTLRFAPLQRDIAEQTLEMEVHIPHYASSTDAGSMRANPSLPGLPLSILQQMGNYSAEQRRYALPCTPVTVREKFSLGFAPQFTVLNTPKPLNEDAHGVHFRASYHMDQQTLQGEREYVDTNPAMVCDVAEYQQRKQTMRAIAKNLRQQVLYQQ